MRFPILLHVAYKAGGATRLKTLKDIDLAGKRVLMRADFNVPMDKEQNIIDDTKIKAALPTINYILEQGASLILMSHLGRPKGEKNVKYSLKPVSKHLASLIDYPIIMAPDSIGADVEGLASKLNKGEVLLLENVRFYKEEEKNEANYANKLAELADVFVNDAFGSAHRAHASTAGVAQKLPTFAGLLMEKEVAMLKSVLEYPESPRMAILGGAKVVDKLGLINNLLAKLDVLLIGGGMANTFLKAQGYNTGKSRVENELLEDAKGLLANASKKGVKIVLPVDVVLGQDLTSDTPAIVVDITEVPDDMMILDIGPETIKLFQEEIAKARTIVWNGPLGVYEYEQFANGTREVAKTMADSAAVTVIGGGDSAAAVQNMGLEDKITHISTGGGATLEFLEGLPLPGVVACNA
ncbi:MAG: phosphoglycerate kinase [Syntrophomonadaceae bacterium]|nr:phosphoglycerate kinase [Syntrophomonadaceae bacterium]